MLDSPDTEAARGLVLGEINVDELRTRLLGELPRAGEDPVVTGNLPLSPKAMRAVNGSIVKAQTLHEPRVSSRLLLLCLLEDGDDGAIRQSLRETGADIEHLQRVLTRPPVEAEA